MAGYDAWVPVGDLPTDGVAIRPAATVVLVDDRPDLQVLVLKRRDASVFVGGHTVFPGGAVDPDDRDPAWSSLATGVTAEEADGALRVPDARAFWIAAVRETIEEVGLVIGVHNQDLARHRHAFDRGEVRLSELVATSGRPLDLSGLHAISRWVTPMPSPRRYDTYFFVARAPRGSEPSADGSEAVEARWTTPAGALEGWREGELTMISPTLATLQRLAHYQSADQVLDAAARGASPQRVRVIDEHATPALFPDDPGYRDPGTRPVLGWTWLPDPRR